MTAPVVVTGGGAGIGHAIALALGAIGHPVAVVDRDARAANDVVAAIRAGGGAAAAFVVDLVEIARFGAMIAAVDRALGTPLILINNAAAGGGEAFAAVTPERFDTVFAVSARASFFLAQAMLPAMRAAGFGRIVNIASLIAARGEAGNPHYAGAKAAMIGFTRAWAVELAPHGITANTVAPALTDTPMARSAFSDAQLDARAARVPAGRLAMPDDTAAIVAFLVSDAARFVTGQAISANGGEFVGAL